MKTAVTIAVLSGALLIADFVVAWRIHHRSKLSAEIKQRLGDVCGVVLALGLLVFVESLLHAVHGVNMLSVFQLNHDQIYRLFVGGAVLGIIYEYVGQFTFPLWYYPATKRYPFLALGLPLFWGVFMLIMQDSWGLFRALGFGPVIAVFLVSLVQYAIIEGFNLISHSWKYKGFANTPYFLIVGWVILTLTFVTIFNHYNGMPFGY